MAEDHVGVVVDVEDKYATIWSFTNLVLYKEGCSGFEKGDCISLISFEKIDCPKGIYIDTKNDILHMVNVAVRFRKFDGKLFGYSPILGEISAIAESYSSSVDTILSVSVIWECDRNQWVIPIFNPKISRLTHENINILKMCEPCRGIVFRIEKNSLVVWSEHHGITELNFDISENRNQSIKPHIGSFLRIRVTKQIHRQYPLIREYKVIEPFFPQRLDVGENGKDNFSIMTEAYFDPKYNESVNGKSVYYVKTSFFGKIYDSLDDTSPIIKPNTKGKHQVWLRGIAYGGILLAFQLVQVQNPENAGRPPISGHKMQSIPRTLPLAPHFMRSRFTGFIYRLYPTPTVYCFELKEDVVLPKHISDEKPCGYWAGKWISFCLDETRNTRYMVLCEPEEVKPGLPTRIDNLGNPEIFVHLQTRDHNANSSQVFCPELEVLVDDFKNCCLGTGVYTLWISRAPTDSIRWRISPSEERDGFRKPDSCFVNFESCKTHLSEMSSPSWLKSKQLRIWPHPYEQAYREQQRDAQKAPICLSPEYCTGWVCTESLSVYCLEKRKEYVLNDGILTVPKEELIGAWVYMTIVTQHNSKDEVVDVMPRTNWNAYPTRVVNGVPEVQMECVYSKNENGLSQLYCPLLGVPISDPFNIIKTEGSQKLWVTRKKGHALIFSVSQSELVSLPKP